jgi:DNA-binding winged helix-turn-helix (wHTH) protein
MNEPASCAIIFGPFRPLPTQRLLLQDGEPVRLGSRALDAPIALLERPGQLVPKNVLISRLWPDTHVEEGNFKVQIAALRRVLGDGKDGVRYIATDPGRGYRVVSPVMFADDPHPSTAAAPAAKPKCNLPSRLTRPVGRADIIDHLARWLMQRRLVTLVGPGGIGKTTLALELAEKLIDIYEHGV